MQPVWSSIAPLHSAKVIVWCAISSGGITGLFLWGWGAHCNSWVVHRHAGNISVKQVKYFVSLIHCGFKWARATAHSAQISMAVLTEMFPGRLIPCFRDINWPAHSSHLSEPDYFLWGYTSKAKCMTHPASTDDLKQWIWEWIQESLTKSYVTWHPCCLDSNTVLNNMEIILKVLYSNSKA
jgi:hypothetical protein